MISYGKLWLLLKSKGMKKTDLLEVISSPTLTKLGKNENVNVSIIGKLCDFLNCQPGDIMENISEEKIKVVIDQFGQLQQVLVDAFKEKGISEQDLLKMYQEALPTYMKKMYNGENLISDVFNQALDEMSKNIKDSEEESENESEN